MTRERISGGLPDWIRKRSGGVLTSLRCARPLRSDRNDIHTAVRRGVRLLRSGRAFQTEVAIGLHRIDAPEQGQDLLLPISRCEDLGLGQSMRTFLVGQSRSDHGGLGKDDPPAPADYRTESADE